MSEDGKADAIMIQAEKKEKSYSFFGGTQKFEEAGELYEKAANLYKMNKQWKEAGDAFKKVANCHLKCNSRHEAASAWVSASNCYKKSDVSDAIECLKLAVDTFCNMGRFQMAAKHQKDIAETYESELDFDQSIEAYKKAADYFSGEDSTSSAHACLLKVAQFSAQNGKYDEAIDVYEKVARASVDNNLLRWSVKDYLFRAGLCSICKGDAITAEKALDKYDNIDATFESTREGKLLRAIVAAFKENDVETFTNVVFEYDTISKLDNWKTTILLKIKNMMKDQLVEGGVNGVL